MVSGIHNLWSLISGTVTPAYGGPEGGYVVRADGGRRKWWRRYCSRQTFAALFADHRGRCRAVWRQVWPLQVYLAAAGLFGGKFGHCRAVWRQVWPLQGRCKVVTLAPLLMMLLLWNILSAIFKLCCFSSNSLQVGVSSCVVSNKNKNNAEL